MKPISDPPMVTVLAEPLRRLRSGLGSGAPAPDQQVLGALTTASATADATESTQTRGLHALESSWSGQAADTAVPVIRTTRSEIGAVADRGPLYAALLSDAHGTSSRAAREVDVIIDDFRRDARAILDTATSAPETDAVIDRAAQAIREALGVVNTAQGEMDGHRQRLRDMGPMTMTTPQGVLTTPIPGTTTTTVPGAVPGQPMDPALVMQLQLQQQLVAAGVQLGTTAIDAGVELGTKIIDRIADVGLKVVDTVGAQAGTAIEQALNPDKADDAKTGPASTAPAGTPGSPVPPKAFDFGGGPAPNPETAPSAPGAAMAAPPPAPPRSLPAEPKPSENGGGGGGNGPFAAPPNSGGHHGGMVIPPGTGQGGGDQERKPRPGQLGVTVPATTTMVTAPAIGADDDR